jgi:hypothetical protein
MTWVKTSAFHFGLFFHDSIFLHLWLPR